MPVDRMLLFGVAVFILALLLQQAQSNRSLPAVLLRQRPALQQRKRRLEAAVERPAAAGVDEAVIRVNYGNIIGNVRNIYHTLMRLFCLLLVVAIFRCSARGRNGNRRRLLGKPVVFVVVGVAVDLHVCRLGLRFATDLCHPLC